MQVKKNHYGIHLCIFSFRLSRKLKKIQKGLSFFLLAIVLFLPVKSDLITLSFILADAYAESEREKTSDSSEDMDNELDAGVLSLEGAPGDKGRFSQIIIKGKTQAIGENDLSRELSDLTGLVPVSPENEAELLGNWGDD